MGFLSEISEEIFGEGPKAVNQQQTLLTPQQQTLLKQLIGQASGMARSDPRAFTGKMAPDLSGLERTSLAALEELAMQSLAPGGDKTIQSAKGAVERAANADETFDLEGFDRMFGESVAAPMLDIFKREVLPELTRRFSGNAAFGSDRREQELLATQDLGKSLTGSRADMLFKTKESAKDRALTAAGLAPGLVRGQTDQLLSLLMGGGVEREAEGAKLSADYNEFVRQQDARARAFDQALSTLGIRSFENITTVDPGKPGLLSGLAPGIGMGLGTGLGNWLSRR